MTNKLTDEQRKIIQDSLKIHNNFEPTKEWLEAGMDFKTNAPEYIRLLLSSEQAWKEEAEKLKNGDCCLSWNEKVERLERENEFLIHGKDQIKQALEKATPGPWNREGREIWYRGEGYDCKDRHIYVCDVQGNNNAHLIANAPEWLRWLLEQNDRQNERIEELEIDNAELREEASATCGDCIIRDERVEQLERALRVARDCKMSE